MTTIDQLQALLDKPTRLIHGYTFKDVLPPLKCMDGTTLSVQASKNHYCTPRENNGPYTEVEVWCIRGAGPEGVTEFDYSDDDPSGYVPIEAVAAFIDRHGGIKQ